MAGKQRGDPPTAGKAADGKRGVKAAKTEIAQRHSKGFILWKETSKLWGWRSGKSK